MCLLTFTKCLAVQTSLPRLQLHYFILPTPSLRLRVIRGLVCSHTASRWQRGFHPDPPDAGAQGTSAVRSVLCLGDRSGSPQECEKQGQTEDENVNFMRGGPCVFGSPFYFPSPGRCLAAINIFGMKGL